MKVLHVAETVKGGVATIIDQLLLDERIESFCLIPEAHESEISNKKNFYLYERTGRNLKSFIYLMIAFIKYFNTVKPDIVHIHSSFAGMICRIILFFFIRKPKIVYCPHAFSFLMDNSSIKKSIYAWIEKILLINTDIVICTSEYEKNISLQYKMPTNKLITIYNSVLPPFHIEKVRNNYRNNLIKVLFVGRLDHQKGVDILADIIKLVDDRFEFTIIGDSVVDRKLNEIFSFPVKKIGWVTKQELSKYYTQADVIIMPSRWESFGLVAVEANSYGKPVIATNCTSLPEIIENGKNGFLFKKDSASEAVSILNQLDIFKLKSMENECLKNYKDRFSTKVMLDKVFSLYSRLK
ncbi:glycosyltransferase [Acinetobacter sp. ESL0695]|uniref:glycosyltransferase n=1 Tax=Acinetobacter sp. ESL0695 TaxID=2983215 RepID=UPI0023EF5936|nr:glycosyltransferase [Acinetobacter sp. ESL0695]WEV48806.1 glycosyltransferase [Acinetobacter sp. ESL0695]